MIKFSCENCGQKIRVPEIHAGKKGKCPKCKNTIVVPSIETTSPRPDQSTSGGSKTGPYDLTLLDVPQKDKTAEQQVSQYGAADRAIEEAGELEEGEVAEEDESVGERKLPWIIDIFLYPISIPSLTTLGIIIVIPLLIDIAAMLLGPFGFFISIPGIVINIVIGLYMYWYICECIRDSAAGGIRAPETLGNAPGLGDMFLQMIRIVGCLAVFFAPVLIYFQYTQNANAIFWSLLAYGVFFFPMGLLAVIMFDSFSGLNPILLIGSIFSTFFPYCGLIIFFYGLCFLFPITGSISPASWIFHYILTIVFIYILMVAAHLLGRFYWRYQEKLNWEV